MNREPMVVVVYSVLFGFGFGSGVMAFLGALANQNFLLIVFSGSLLGVLVQYYAEFLDRVRRDFD